MDFFKNKVKKFQEKKLDEILFKIQFHESTRKKLEEEMKKTRISDEKSQNQITYHSQMEEIWKSTEKKVRRQMEENK